MQSCDLKINTLFDSLVESVTREYISDKQNYPWIIGFSGGKDSSLVAHIVFQVILNIRPGNRNRDVYIVSNDTLVESPLVVEHITEQLSLIDEAAKNFNLPIKIHITRPRVEHTYLQASAGSHCMPMARPILTKFTFPCFQNASRGCSPRGISVSGSCSAAMPILLSPGASIMNKQ